MADDAKPRFDRQNFTILDFSGFSIISILVYMPQNPVEIIKAVQERAESDGRTRISESGLGFRV